MLILASEDCGWRLSSKARGIAQQDVVVRKSDQVERGEGCGCKDAGENQACVCFRLALADGTHAR
jgi:hypothetical protein